jgi:hypothetical protein
MECSFGQFPNGKDAIYDLKIQARLGKTGRKHVLALGNALEEVKGVRSMIIQQ